MNCIWLALWGVENASSIVSRLAKYGISPINVSALSGYSTLHIAARFGQVDALPILVASPCNVEIKDICGRTPLHSATAVCSPSIIPALVELGADVHARDKKGRTALHLAARMTNVVAIRSLVRFQSDVNVRDNAGWTPLIHACSWDEATVVENADSPDTLGAIGTLLEAGASVNCATRRGLTALHFASVNGRQDLAIALILSGANQEARTLAGRTALHLAAMANQSVVVEVLAARGSTVNTVDRGGNSALHSAAARGQECAVVMLLRLGARDSGRNKAGRSALDCAARSGHTASVAALIEHRISGNLRCVNDELYLQTALLQARRHGKRSIVQLILSYGAWTDEDCCAETTTNGREGKNAAGDDDFDDIIGGDAQLVELLGSMDSMALTLPNTQAVTPRRT